MGVNLFPCILLRHEPVRRGSYSTHWVTEPVEWDTTRHHGDREFAESKIEWLERLDDPNQMSTNYNRPADINEARSWIKESTHEGNQPRLLDLMDKMEADPRIYIYISY